VDRAGDGDPGHTAEAPFIVSTIREYLHGRQLNGRAVPAPGAEGGERADDGAVLSIAPGRRVRRSNRSCTAKSRIIRTPP
jgi:hypothetical protein